jgi:hypothetical protein
MKFLILSLAASVMSLSAGCASKQKISDKEAEKIAFSIVKAKSPVGDLIIIGSSPGCSIKWEVSKTILTHRMNCETTDESELWAYLLGMSSKLKVEYRNRPLNFVRFTTKDFPGEEKYVGKLVGASKLWGKLNKKNIKVQRYKDYSNTFLAKVIEKKRVYSIVPKALMTVGYQFEVSETKIENYKVSSNGKLIPKSAKVVFKAEQPYRPRRKGL